MGSGERRTLLGHIPLGKMGGRNSAELLRWVPWQGGELGWKLWAARRRNAVGSDPGGLGQGSCGRRAENRRAGSEFWLGGEEGALQRLLAVAVR